MDKDTHLVLGPSRADLAAMGLLTSSSRSFLFLPLAGTAGTSWQRGEVKGTVSRDFLNTFLATFLLRPQRQLMNYHYHYQGVFFSEKPSQTDIFHLKELF
jgi:hypothetical protein